MPQTSEEAEEFVSEYTSIWNERDYSKIPDLVSESFTGTVPGAEYHGQDGLEEWIEEVTAAFPDFEVEPNEVVAGEGTVMAEAEFSMTHEGEFRGIPPTGEAVEMPHMARFRIEDGKVEAHREYYDRQEFADQLGLDEA